MDEQEAPSESTVERYGDRVYLVRLALGDGKRNAMSLADFDDLIATATGRRIHASELSRIERHVRSAILEDAEAIARVDPQGRSPAWLIWGDSSGTQEARPVDKPVAPPPQKYDDLPEAHRPVIGGPERKQNGRKNA